MSGKSTGAADEGNAIQSVDGTDAIASSFNRTADDEHIAIAVAVATDPGKNEIAVTEYARALYTLGTDQQDHLAALEIAILGWLDSKRGLSGSERTRRAYADTLASFRAALRREGLDLDGPATAVALVAQAWAGGKGGAGGTGGTGGKGGAGGTGGTGGKGGAGGTGGTGGADYIGPGVVTRTQRPLRAPATSTYNQRLACVSSFYRYAHKQGILGYNPIERVERRRVQAYAGAKALTADYVKQALAAIDRTIPSGARDYAMLMVYLQTGRRLSEVAALEYGDLEEQPGNKLRVTFRRCKGGKVLYDTLTHQISSALRTYLRIIYGSDLSSIKVDAPVWISLAERNGTRGGRLSKVSISRICKMRLGTTRVHALRHTMAHVMEQTGAPVSLIQQRLAHNSLATTGIYLAALRQDDNPYADEIGKAFGAD